MTTFKNAGIALISLLFSVMSFTVLASNENSDYQLIEWIELMPADDLDALLNPPEILLEVADGASNDTLAELDSMIENEGEGSQFFTALKSTRVIESFDGKAIKIPGFIVPIENDEQQRVTAFFIVPYFGACLHLPPPPPNQILFASVQEGIELETLQTPFWFEGKIVIEHNANALGSSAYKIELDNHYLFEG